MLVTSIFPFSHNVFYRIKDRNHNFSNVRFVVCKCFEFCPVQNFVVWLKIKTIYNFINLPFVAEPVWLDQYRTGPESRRTLVPSQSRPISFRSLMINIVTGINSLSPLFFRRRSYGKAVIGLERIFWGITCKKDLWERIDRSNGRDITEIMFNQTFVRLFMRSLSPLFLYSFIRSFVPCFLPSLLSERMNEWMKIPSNIPLKLMSLSLPYWLKICKGKSSVTFIDKKL